MISPYLVIGDLECVKFRFVPSGMKDCFCQPKFQFEHKLLKILSNKFI